MSRYTSAGDEGSALSAWKRAGRKVTTQHRAARYLHQRVNRWHKRLLLAFKGQHSMQASLSNPCQPAPNPLTSFNFLPAGCQAE